MSESTVMKPLTVEERANKGDQMASLVAQIDGIKAQAKAKAFEFRNAIEALHEQLVELANVMRFGLEETSQMTLFAGQARETTGATQALAEIAKRACACEGGPESEVKSPACPVHGVTATIPPEKLEAALDEQLAEDVAETAEQLRQADELVEAVDVGTVEEPASVAAFRRGRKRA